MKNWIYTAFCRKPSEPKRAEELLTETESKEQLKKAIERAKQQGFIITRIYTPNTIIDEPDFISCINL